MANALSALAERRTNKVWTIVLLALGFSDGNLGLGAAVFLADARRSRAALA